MDACGAFLAPALAEALAGLPITALLDIGGSSGIYAGALLADRPNARAAVFERPPVDGAARTLLAARGLADRVDVITGDMFADPLPTGFDVHLFSQVLHDWDGDRVRHLLAASFAALSPGGWLLDHDTHVDADKRGPLPVAEYSVLLMHSTPGKCWSVGELTDLARATGFVAVEHRPPPVTAECCWPASRRRRCCCSPTARCAIPGSSGPRSAGSSTGTRTPFPASSWTC